ncbi:MAG TPA: UvrD-helicase domain-containing protein [Cyclobacteriaceae bacterium]
MSSKPFVVYRSSAGSGKTFTLAKEYIKLSLRSPDYFQKILAVTFTNKAAEEMKNRVISYLEALSKGEGLMTEMLLHETLLRPDELKEKAHQSLKCILHNYSRFSISTIDSFFHQVVRSFAMEIGIRGGFDVELDKDLVLDKVVDELLADIHHHKALVQWLKDFSIERLTQGEKYEIREEIKKLGNELFQERFKTKYSKFSENERNLEHITQLDRQLRKNIFSFENHLRSIGKKGLEAIAKHNLTEDDFSNKKKGVIGQFNKWNDRNFEAPNKTALKGSEDLTVWYTKASKNKEMIRSLAASTLQPLLVEGINFFNKNVETYKTALEIKRYLYVLGILTDLNVKLKQYREKNDLILISDLPDFLNQITANSDAPFIFEKVGHRYNHFLIDEFQDTSVFQWNNFQPLIKNSLASGNFNMIVGDVKQSIYRWRGSDWQIFSSGINQEITKEQTYERFLDTNYRSHNAVVAFNNSLFSYLSLTDNYRENLAETYRGVSQKVFKAPEENPGYVEVNFFPNDVDDQKHESINRTIKTVEKLQDNGYSTSDMAILVRNNKAGEEIVEGFYTYKSSERAQNKYNYDVVSAEFMYLRSSYVVKFILSIFKYLHTEDDIALAQIIYDYQVYILGYAKDENKLFLGSGTVHLLPDEFLLHKSTLTRLPLYEMVEGLIRIFSLYKVKTELAYLQAFQDAILDFSRNEKNTIGKFLEWWDETGHKRAVTPPKQVEAIQVLTIHKAKGLEFKVVLIPFCTWALDHNNRNDYIIWSNKHHKKLSAELDAVPLKYGKNLEETIYAEDYKQEKEKIFIDNLNILYVALTRAEEALIVFGGKQNDSKEDKNVSDLIYRYAQKGSHQAYWNENELQLKLGGLKSKSTQKSLEYHESIEDYISSSWRKKINIKKYGSDYLLEDQHLKAPRINEGVVIHEMLASIKYEYELKKLLNTSAIDWGLPEDIFEKITQQIQSIIKHPDINEYFQIDYKVDNELHLIAPDGSLYRVDRIMTTDEKAVIIDYKTGNPLKKHKHQVEHYAYLLHDMGYEKVEGYLLYTEGPRLTQII